MSTKLSVNINKFATLRNARGGNNPNITQVARDCELFGAEGITIHPRPDERHIRYADARELKKIVNTEYNIEGFPDPKFMDLVLELVPEQVTLVPDAPDVITSNSGWDIENNFTFLQETIHQLKQKNIRCSLFLDPIPERVELAKNVGADRIELYTEKYATEFSKGNKNIISAYKRTAIAASQMGIGVNAGHDLDLHNLNYFVCEIPEILEVSIGHALVCDALYLGLQNTIQQYKAKLKRDFFL